MFYLKQIFFWQITFPSFSCLKLVLLLQGLCSLLGKQSSFLGIEKLASSSVGTARYIFHILNVPFILKWQHGICIRRNKFYFQTFVFFQALQHLLRWLEASGWFTGWVSHPLEIRSLLHSSNSFFKRFLCSQGSVWQLIFKTRERYWNKISCSGNYNIGADVQSSLITEQILTSPVATATSPANVVDVAPHQHTNWRHSCHHRVRWKYFSIQQHAYY